MNSITTKTDFALKTKGKRISLLHCEGKDYAGPNFQVEIVLRNTENECDLTPVFLPRNRRETVKEQADHMAMTASDLSVIASRSWPQQIVTLSFTTPIFDEQEKLVSCKKGEFVFEKDELENKNTRNELSLILHNFLTAEKDFRNYTENYFPSI